MTGCPGVDADALTIASAWTPAERVHIEKAIRAALPGGMRLRWVLLAPGDDLRRVVRRRIPPDLILGGPRASYEALTTARAFEPDASAWPTWRLILSRGLGTLTPSAAPASAHWECPPFEDPRRVPWALAVLKAVLRSHPWAEGYAALVLHDPGDDPYAVDSGHADVWTEGVAVVRGARHADTARAVLAELTRSGRAIAPPRFVVPTAADSLLADLLGATLVDARPELIVARAALKAAKQPERPRQWMTQAPPWPPASVAKILEREANAMPLLETLAAQIAPEADVRAWLLRSWLAPPRPIDGSVLDELAGAVDGRLAREPRFRSWLRGEWTAWARQRYRRVTRRAGGWVPSAAVAGGKS